MGPRRSGNMYCSFPLSSRPTHPIGYFTFDLVEQSISIPSTHYILVEIFTDEMKMILAAAAKSLQSCPTQRPHGLQPNRPLRPQDFPGKSTGVGCHCLLQWYLGLLQSHPGRQGRVLVEVKQYQSNFDNWDFPGGPVVKNLPGFDPWSRKIPHAAEQLSHNYWTSMLQLLKP